MGFLTLSGKYTILEEANLRMVCKSSYYCREQNMFCFCTVRKDHVRIADEGMLLVFFDDAKLIS
jgi:hypothetical protein